MVQFTGAEREVLGEDGVAPPSLSMHRGQCSKPPWAGSANKLSNKTVTEGRLRDRNPVLLPDEPGSSQGSACHCRVVTILMGWLRLLYGASV